MLSNTLTPAEPEIARGTDDDSKKRKRTSNNSLADLKTGPRLQIAAGKADDQSGLSGPSVKSSGISERPKTNVPVLGSITSSPDTGPRSTDALRTVKTTRTQLSRAIINAPVLNRSSRAIPALQLDVDELTLEYLLHKSICSQFHELNSRYENEFTKPRSHSKEGYEDIAQRLLHAFQASLEQFQFLHDGHQLEAGTEFNIMLLETIIVFRSIESPLEAVNEHKENTQATTMSANGLHETKAFLRHRMLTTSSGQQDHDILYGSALFDDSAEDAIESLRNHLFYGWTKEDLHETPNLSFRTFPIFRLMVRFMVLSARINQQLDGTDINAHWMRLACELMLHAALEALDGSDFLRLNGDLDPGRPVAPVQPGLLDCFAFRCIPDTVYSSDYLRYRRSPFDDALSSNDKVFKPLARSTKDEEQAISEMFSRDTDGWDKMRRLFLSEFIIPPQALAEAIQKGSMTPLSAHYEQCVVELRTKYPFAEMKASLLACLDSLWTINTSPSISGRPALVQIEEGGLDGLNDEEFSMFLARVGLSRPGGELELLSC